MCDGVNRREVARYLGLKGKSPDARTAALMEEAIVELRAAEPRHVLKRFPLSVEDQTALVGPLTLASKSLAVHVKDCWEVILLAATLGVKADMMIRRASVCDMSRAMVLQACAAAKLEGYLDSLCAGMEKELEPEGLSLKTRFSPGYGDLSLDCQGEVLALLEAKKRIGLFLTDGSMMVPTKSVTAIIGLTPLKQKSLAHSCTSCMDADCPYREG